MQPISRRTFLVGSLAAAAAGGALSGCSDGGETPSVDGAASTDPAPTTDAPAPTPAPDPTATDTAPASTAPAPTEPAVELSGDPFTLGVASGDPAAGTVVLWTRLAPDPLGGGGMPADDVEVAWEVAGDEGFGEVVASGTVTATAQYGHSVHVRAELEPGWWWYRFRVGGYTSPVGRTRTAPTGADNAAEVRFASASCQNYQDGWYTAHADIASQGLDFVVFLGDYIYEGRGVATVGENDTVRTHGDAEADTLDGYRTRYALYKSDPDLQAAHASCPWFVTWDDHEVENNYAADLPQDGSDPAAFAERRRQAYQAWWEHQPVDLPPPGDDFVVHRAARWGDLLELAILDGRQYRSDQACGDPSLSLDPPCPETFDETRTMLGDEQEAWLLDLLANGTAAWRVVAQQTVFGDVTIGGAVLNYDQWDGYPAERNRIVAALDPAANTVVLTGDIHFAGTGTIRQGERGVGTPVGVEFVATSISSGGRVNPAVTEVVKAIPDILDVELEHRGYILHTVTPSRWSAEYRMVETVKEVGAPMFVHATYAVDAGTNTVRLA